MKNMFFKCSSLLSVKVNTNWKTININMSYLFAGSSLLSIIEGKNKWENVNINNMSYMFSRCSSLSSIDGITNWETKYVANMSYMFQGCSSLSSLDMISNWETKMLQI